MNNKLNFRQYAYEKYKADWMLERNIALSDFIKLLDEYLGEALLDLSPEDFANKKNWPSLTDLTEELYSNGFEDGEIFSSYEEFLDNEYRDNEIMKDILGEHDYFLYLSDRNKYQRTINQIVGELKLLEKAGDNFGYDFHNGKGLFVEVVDFGRGKEYSLEANNVNEDGGFEPISSYNASCKFGDIDDFRRTFFRFNKAYKMC